MVRRSTPAGRSRPRPALLAGLVAVVLAACAYEPWRGDPLGAPGDHRPPADQHDGAPRDDRSARNDRSPRRTRPRHPTPRWPRPTPRPAARRRRSIPGAELLDLGDAKQPRAYDDLIRADARRPRAVVGRGVPRSLRRAVRALDRSRLRRLSRARRRDPRLRAGRGDDVRGDQPVRRLLLRAGRLHGLRRRSRRHPRHALRRVRPDDPRRRLRPRVRPRHPVARRRVRARPADHHHRAAGRLLRRGVGRPSGAR